ncbi:hypothetical protein AT6N2_C1568 [Agrobacterium tumefaciens]|nr:hypothetical protein AT6N2_C1568 [Agrobacterium tumefaciens]
MMRRAAPISVRSLLAIEDHAAVVEDTIDKFTVCGKAGVVPIVDVVALHLISPLIGALAFAARFVIAAIGQKLLTNVAIAGDPHAEIRVVLSLRDFSHVSVRGVFCPARLPFGRSGCKQKRY